MQQLIASFLFQNKTCPLPGLGTLSIVTKPSQSDFIQKQILAPVPLIHFSESDTDANELINYISIKKGCTNSEAKGQLNNFTTALKNGETLVGAGNFSTDASGNIIFNAQKLPQYFTPSVNAERIIHPEANHNILVGDKETTASVMTEYYAEEPAKRNYWWVWAIVLAAIAVTIIIIYLNDKNSSATFGNAVDYTLA